MTSDLAQYVVNRVSEILTEATALGDPDRTWVDIAREATRNPTLERFLPVHTVRLTDGWIECTPTCEALGPHTGNGHVRREYRAEDRHGQNDTKPTPADAPKPVCGDVDQDGDIWKVCHLDADHTTPHIGLGTNGELAYWWGDDRG